MKRIVFIGNIGYKKKIYACLLGLFVFYVLFFSLKVINLQDIRKYFSQSAGEFFYKLTVNASQKSYGVLAYKNYNINKKTVAETVIDNVNSSISYYGYVKENVTETKLVIYDPNEIRTEESFYWVAEGNGSDDRQNETDIKNTEKGDEKAGEETEKQEVPVSVSGNGIMKLSGTGPGTVYSLESLNDFNFLLSGFYVVPQRASVLSSDLNASELLSIDMSIEKNPNVPQILIYHTHSMEGFSDSIEGNFDTNIVAVGTCLAKLLSEGYGYNVIHCTESFDYVNGKLDRSQAYTYARTSLEQILADNPTIEVILDIHRDGVNEDLRLVSEVNGKTTSQIMFFNGMSRTSWGGDIDYLYNKYRKQNLAFSLQLKLLAEEYFPGFTRKNYLDAYQYNLDLRERALLVEVGAQTNTLQEAKNAMEPLAALLDRVLSGDGGI